MWWSIKYWLLVFLDFFVFVITPVYLVLILISPDGGVPGRSFYTLEQKYSIGLGLSLILMRLLVEYGRWENKE